MALRSMMLIILSLGLLVVPGVLYNNNTNSGLNNAQTLGCGGPFAPGTVVDPTCQGTVNEGCQSSAAYCTLSGQTVSFLSINSPFTALLTGNIFGLFTSISSGSTATSHGPFDAWGGGSFIALDCTQDTLTQALSSFAAKTCTQVGPAGNNLTGTAPLSVAPFYPSTATHSLHFRQWIGNGSTTWACDDRGVFQWIVYSNATGTHDPTGDIGYTLHGCDYAINANNTRYGILFAIPFDQYQYNGGVTHYYHVKAYAQVTDYSTFYCSDLLTGDPVTGAGQIGNTQHCTQLGDTMFQTHAANSGGNSLTVIAPFITFIIGLALLILGTGISVSAGGSILASGATVGGGSNEQGTRMAQTLGLGLIVWSPLYSEFSPWFTSGVLPYGFDGTAGIISLVLTGMMFFGLFWRSLSRD